MRGHCHQLSRYQIVCWKRSGYYFNALFHGLFGCLQNGYECFNHIRTIAVIDNQIYACGTGAYKPTDYYLDVSLPAHDCPTQRWPVIKTAIQSSYTLVIQTSEHGVNQVLPILKVVH